MWSAAFTDLAKILLPIMINYEIIINQTVGATRVAAHRDLQFKVKGRTNYDVCLFILFLHDALLSLNRLSLSLSCALPLPLSLSLSLSLYMHTRRHAVERKPFRLLFRASPIID